MMTPPPPALQSNCQFPHKALPCKSMGAGGGLALLPGGVRSPASPTANYLAACGPKHDGTWGGGGQNHVKAATPPSHIPSWVRSAICSQLQPRPHTHYITTISLLYQLYRNRGLLVWKDFGCLKRVSVACWGRGGCFSLKLWELYLITWELQRTTKNTDQLNRTPLLLWFFFSSPHNQCFPSLLFSKLCDLSLPVDVYKNISLYKHFQKVRNKS